MCPAASSALPWASIALTMPMRAAALLGDSSRAFSKDAWALSGLRRDNSSSPLRIQVWMSSFADCRALSSCFSAAWVSPAISPMRARPRRASLFEGSFFSAASKASFASLTFCRPSCACPRRTSQPASNSLAESFSIRPRASSKRPCNSTARTMARSISGLVKPRSAARPSSFSALAPSPRAT